VLRTIESNRFVTGVTWVDGELWHGTWEGDDSDIRRIDPKAAPVRAARDAARHRRERPRVGRRRLFYAGGGGSGTVRAAPPPGPLVRKHHVRTGADSS
jgi:hypothetical protein